MQIHQLCLSSISVISSCFCSNKLNIFLCWIWTSNKHCRFVCIYSMQWPCELIIPAVVFFTDQFAAIYLFYLNVCSYPTYREVKLHGYERPYPKPMSKYIWTLLFVLQQKLQVQKMSDPELMLQMRGGVQTSERIKCPKTTKCKLRS